LSRSGSSTTKSLLDDYCGGTRSWEWRRESEESSRTAPSKGSSRDEVADGGGDDEQDGKDGGYFVSRIP